MEEEIEKSFIDQYRGLLIFAGVFVALLIIIFAILFTIKYLNSPKPALDTELISNNDLAVVPVENESSALPQGEEKNEGDINGNGEYDGWEVEKFSFGDFYTPNTDRPEISMEGLSLPINVKVDIANYHDVNRKIDLETGLTSLNNNGFAWLDNPFTAEADTFYGMYDLLNSKQLPALITSDFLLYYYQNNLKAIFKEVEGTTFYDNLWQTNLKLYNIAKVRYEKRVAEIGIVNDPTLEAERLELAFLATTLSLLQPRKQQISQVAGLDTSDMFSEIEASFYSFQVPNYLQSDIARELELIEEAQGTHKSPVFSYEQDYQRFEVKKEYQQSARLNNFYLASLWLNSPFPLYYKGDYCPSCSLDMDDWRINFYTAILLSKDFADNQDLQNSWAKVYKLMSFFNGLRGDLTYLQYANVFDDIYGQDKNPTEVLAGSEAEIDEKLLAIQTRLADFDFLDIEGAISKNDIESRSLLGMKMLSESFWPDEYIYQQFAYPVLGASLDSDVSKQGYLGCSVKGQAGTYRCYSSAYDIVNLIRPLSSISSSFYSNSLFENYLTSQNNLLTQIENFSVSSWHSNSFWSVLDISSKFLNEPENRQPFYAQNNLFQQRKVDTVAAAVLNSKLEIDNLVPYQETGKSLLGGTTEENKFFEYRYIEPNAVLVQDLLANTDMLIEMFNLLEITERDNGAIVILNDMKKKFQVSLDIIKKELKGEALSGDDYKFIDAFSREYTVKSEGDKVSILKTQEGRSGLKQSIDGVKLLLIIYKKDGKNIFTIGPVFNFLEKK